VRSLDASVRSLPGGRVSTGLVDRTLRGSPPRQEALAFDDDCAEYVDRFLPGYDRGRLLGRGACAVVWLAAPCGQSTVVAIKQVAKGSSGKKRSDMEAARKEIFFGSYFFHVGGEPKLTPARYPGIQSIAKLLDYTETKRDIWLVMEYGGSSLTKCVYEIRGEFLRGERLYRVSHLPLMQAMKRDVTVIKQVLRQLMSALVILAEHHIVHSDIKPDNILVEDDLRNGSPRCRFIDLGSAFTFDCPDSVALATPEYMPPEALEACAGRPGGIGGGGLGACRLSLGRSGIIGGASGGGGRKSSADLVPRFQKRSQPWSFDIWSLGTILLELCLGTPLWLSYKCRVADDTRLHCAATGLFAVPGRDPDKILAKQADALKQKGLQNILRGAPGVPLGDGGLELLSAMLIWEPMDRIAPQDALEHTWLQKD